MKNYAYINTSWSRAAVLCVLMVLLFLTTRAQTTTVAGDYKVINIGDNGYGDYTRSLILLHKIYNGALIDHNYAIGTITAMRGNSGGGNRMNVVNVNTSSSYNSTTASFNSYDDYSFWALKTCIYNGSKYLALNVPYIPAYHSWGYQFSGWTTSTGESMKSVAYEVNGSPVNQSVLSNIQDFSPNMIETHAAAGFNITGGNVGIGTTTPDAKLAVNGTIHTKEVKVDLTGWPDYVFKPKYNLPSLIELKTYIDKNQHLPEMPSEREVAKNGINLGEIVRLQTKKIEELTLYLIEQQKQMEQLKQELITLILVRHKP
jgi:hypothetical protein